MKTKLLLFSTAVAFFALAVLVPRVFAVTTINLPSNTSPTVQLQASGNSYFDGGNIGIGTTGPASLLDVSGPGASIDIHGSYNANLNIVPSGTGANAWNIGAQGAGSALPVGEFNITNSTAGLAVMTITGGGNVGIGTTAPAYTLDVNGTGNFTQPVIVGTPTAGSDAATKSYVDSAVANPGTQNISAANNSGGGSWSLGSSAWFGNAPASTGVDSATGFIYNGGSGSQLFTLSSGPGQTSLQLDGSAFVGDAIGYNPFGINGSWDGYLAVANSGSFGGSLDVAGNILASGGINVGNNQTKIGYAGISTFGGLNSGAPIFISNGGDGGNNSFFPFIYQNYSALNFGFVNFGSSAYGGVNASSFNTVLQITGGGAVYTGTPQQTANSATTNQSIVVRNVLDNGSGGASFAGNVGIGTTAPSSPLTVDGEVEVTSGSSNYAEGIRIHPAPDGYSGLFLGAVPGSNGSGVGQWNLLGYPSATGLFGIRYNSSDFFDITSGGYVGIGTTAPSGKLFVADTAGETYNATGNLNDSNVYIQSAYGGRVAGTGAALSFVIPANTDGSNAWDQGRILVTPDNNNNSDAHGRMYLQTRGCIGGCWNWTNNLTLTSNGNVGVDQTNPAYTLDVNGTGEFTGKLTANTIDPLYTIHGTNYSTYVPGMTGEKEETAGVVDLQKSVGGGASYSYTMSFATAPKGSDLWLFAQATNLANTMNQMIVSLTPSFDGNVWYTKDAAADTLTIHGTVAGEVSYTLTAPRFDAAQWPNRAPANESSTTGLIIN